jgi:hypothetical protein
VAALLRAVMGLRTEEELGWVLRMVREAQERAQERARAQAQGGESEAGQQEG